MKLSRSLVNLFTKIKGMEKDRETKIKIQKDTSTQKREHTHTQTHTTDQIRLIFIKAKVNFGSFLKRRILEPFYFFELTS